MERAVSARHCLATVTDRRYLPGTVIMISSFLRHNPWFDGDVVVLHDGLPVRSRRRLLRFPGIRLVQIGEELRGRLRALATRYPDLRPRLARFHSLQAFALTGYERVLYLDSDILCIGDVRPLLDPPLPGSRAWEAAEPPLVACPDQTRFRDQVRDAETFIPMERGGTTPPRDVIPDCFNTGVMVIRPDRLDPETTEGLFARLHPDRWTPTRTGHTDQAVLNRHFGSRCGRAPERYNYLLASDSDRWERPPMSEAVLLHFLGKPKPWEFLRRGPPGDARQTRRAWELWRREARRDAVRRFLEARDAGPLVRLAAAGTLRLAARSWRMLRPSRPR